MDRYKLVVLCLSIVLAISILGCADGGVSITNHGNSATGKPPSDYIRDSTPVVLPTEALGIHTIANEKAILDYSKTDSGYICAKSLIAPTLVKVLVKFSGVQYQYALRDSNDYVTIPLSEGNGNYDVSFWENLYDDSYAAIFSQNLDVTLSDPFLPFLHPNQFVNYRSSDRAVALSQELTANNNGIVNTISDIYLYIIKNIKYDFEKAASVASYYIPVIDETLETKKGICFDYAVLTASMLRAQRIPSKLVIGYAGSAYHAWIEVYSSEEGWIKKIYFDGENYVLMDPTFASAGGGQVDITSIIGDGENYNPRFYY